MRGDQLARQWRIIRAIEASPNGLTVAEIAKREETGIRTSYRDLEALQPTSHAKAQSAPSKRSTPILPFIKIFLPHCFRRYPHFFFFHSERYNAAEAAKFAKKKGPLRPLRLCVREVDDFMRHSFKVMQDEVYTVKVRISPGWARWVGEKIWHESQKAKKNGDGSLELTFRVTGLDEIKRWVLSFGPEALVLEPENLKEMIRKDLSRNLALYSTGPIAVKSMKEIRAI